MKLQLKWTPALKYGLTAFILSFAIAVLLTSKSNDLKILMRLLIGGTFGFHILHALFKNGMVDFRNQFTFSRILLYIASIFTLIAGINHFSQYDNPHHIGSFFVVNGNAWIVDFFGVLLAGLIFYILFTSLYLLWERKKKTENESVKAELLTLKNQINPHFYFNALNNLYALIKTDQDEAQAFVLKLSDLMRYTIYKGGKKYVTLEEELDYLRNYIDLQTSRFKRAINVHFKTRIEDPNTKISPLLFIILLENAFKHGVEHMIDGSEIEVELTENEGEVHFRILNAFEPSGPKKQKGIGLKNLKESLNLLYPNRHILKLERSQNRYIANLSIST